MTRATLWHGFAVTTTAPPRLAIAQQRVEPIARGWQVEFSGEAPLRWSAVAHALLGVSSADPATYALSHDDTAAGTYRAAAFRDDTCIGALLVAPTPLAAGQDWLAARLGTPLDAGERFRLLDGRPGGAMTPPGPLVCFCRHVGRDRIVEAIAAGAASIEAIGEATTAGTNCGNCQPDLAALLAASGVAVPVGP